MTVFVQVGVGPQKRILLDLSQLGHPVDIVMPIALDVCDAEQRHQRQVLLQCQAGLDRQIVALMKKRAAVALRIPSPRKLHLILYGHTRIA